MISTVDEIINVTQRRWCGPGRAIFACILNHNCEVFLCYVGVEIHEPSFDLQIVRADLCLVCSVDAQRLDSPSYGTESCCEDARVNGGAILVGNREFYGATVICEFKSKI